MKKVLSFILILSLILTGCSGGNKIDSNINIHENIRKEVAEASYEVIKMIENKVNDDGNLDMDLVASYNGKYLNNENYQLTGEEYNLVMHTFIMSEIKDYTDKGVYNNNDFETDLREWYNTLSSGEMTY